MTPSPFSDQALQAELEQIRRNAAIHDVPTSMRLQSEAIARQSWELGRREQLEEMAHEPIPAGVPARYGEAVRAARTARADAQQVYDAAQAGAMERIREDRPSEGLAQLWLEDATLKPQRALEAAQQALTDRTVELGNAIATVQELARVEAADAGRREQAKRAYDQQVAAADRDLQRARQAVAAL